jgi:cytochrome P450
METKLDLATLDVATPEHYEQNGYPHREWAYLRKHAPIFWYERPNVDPFWVVSKHADIVWLSKQPERLLNAPRLAVFPNDVPPPPEGETRHLFYPSANRDEEIFPDGNVFRIDRSPNDQIGFGRGEHVCLGGHLARLEIRAVFEELRTRLVRAEVAGPIDRVRSSFVGGIKRAPLRWEVGPGR